ncbi:uncharacterized protein [Apostichopus japonicus]|uniref:uncharacterized protein isoform X2 n=1 Tax=Stichopus japonicus TaxID=307972 RepID=UPI003AB5567B
MHHTKTSATSRSMEEYTDASAGEELGQTIEMPPKHNIPFVQSSQTVRRSAIAVNHPNTDPHHTTLGNRQHPPALDLDKLLADQEYKQRHLLAANQSSQVDGLVDLKESQTMSRYADGSLFKVKSLEKLPKPSELLRRSRKRTYKQQHTVSKNAMAVEEHVTQLQRKKTNFYGGVQIQRNEETFSPQDVKVQATRAHRLQQVPSLSEMVQHTYSPTRARRQRVSEMVQHTSSPTRARLQRVSEMVQHTSSPTRARLQRVSEMVQHTSSPTRAQLQQVPGLSEMVQHTSSPTNFWSTNDWLLGVSSRRGLTGLPKSYSSLETPVMAAEDIISDEQRIGTASSVFEEHEVLSTEEYQRKENLDLSYYRSTNEHPPVHPEE